MRKKNSFNSICGAVVMTLCLVSQPLAAEIDIYAGADDAGKTLRPMLKTPNQPASSRVTPAPYPIEDYHGKLQQGYQTIRFVAPGGQLRWDAWNHQAFIRVIEAALELVELRAVGDNMCNRYFAERMPGGKSLAEIWHATGADRVRISFSPGPSGTWRAGTYGDTAPFEWTITETTVLLGPESVASALVHEATRTNGVGPDYAIAFGAERACGMEQYVLSESLIKQLGWRLVRK